MSTTMPTVVQQNIPHDVELEVIVVDNNSSDNTKELVLDFASKTCSPIIRYVYEEKVGLSHARNTGISISNGQVVAFLDDDVLVSSDWIKNILNTYVTHPDTYSVGGKTIPYCDPPIPIWFKGKMLRFVGGHNLGEHEILITGRSSLQGANMSFRRDVFNRIGLFRNHLGRRGKMVFSHEDFEYFQRIYKHNLTVYYNPRAIVKHYMPKERLAFKQLLKTRFYGGMSEAKVDFLFFRNMFVTLKTLKKILFTFVIIHY